MELSIPCSKGSSAAWRLNGLTCFASGKTLSPLQTSSDLTGDSREVFLGSKLSVLTLQETFLVLVFKAGTNSVSKYVTVRSLTGRKKPTAEEAGRLSILGWGAESVGDLVPGDLMYLIPLFCLYLSKNSYSIL